MSTRARRRQGTTPPHARSLDGGSDKVKRSSLLRRLSVQSILQLLLLLALVLTVTYLTLFDTVSPGKSESKKSAAVSKEEKSAESNGRNAQLESANPRVYDSAVSDEWLMARSSVSLSEYFGLASLTTDDVRSLITKNPAHDVHLVVSSGCSEQQNWQCEVALHSWAALSHFGQITRLVSGCKDAAARRRALDTGIVSNRLHFYFTEDYSPTAANSKGLPLRKGESFHYFNKPFGVNEWLSRVPIAESFVVLLDPDMALTDVFDFHLRAHSPLVDDHPDDDATLPLLREGHPISQAYGIGAKWLPWKVCTTGDCLEISESEAWKYYSVGPPYMMHVKDWRKVAQQWADYSPDALRMDPPPSILAEMYSFSMASAHFGLRHKLLRSMVSDPGASATEAWPRFIESAVGGAMFHSAHIGSAQNPATAARNPHSQLGIHVIHYCQGFWLGSSRRNGHLKTRGFNFHKGHVPVDILHNCSRPLLVEAPVSVEAFARDPSTDGRMVWILHHIIRRINAAMANYKQQHCAHWRPEYLTVLAQPEGDAGVMHYALTDEH